MIKTFKVKTIRTVKSPSDDQVTTYFVWVNMLDLPADISTKVNPRDVNMRTTTAKKLLGAVSDADPFFDIHNRGIVILAAGVKFDSTKGTIQLDLDDDEDRYGILDGGHTYEAIKQRRDQIPADVEKYVKLEIFVGENLDAAALSDARNTSVQVSDIALFNLEDRFNFLKEAIKDEPYAKNIAYKDNEDKPIPVADVLRLMYAFNIKKFPDDTSAPISSYSGKANVFKDFRSEWDLNSDGSEPTKSNIYKRLSAVLPELVDLHELIQVDMVERYKDYKKLTNSGANFGRVRGIESSKDGSPFKTEFKEVESDYSIANGYIMPMFGAFRALLQEAEDGELEWMFDPIEIWESVGTTLVQTTFDTDTNPQTVGKSKTLWQANYRIVEGEKNRRMIKKLQEQIS